MKKERSLTKIVNPISIRLQTLHKRYFYKINHTSLSYFKNSKTKKSMNVKKDRIEKEYHITSFLKSEPVAILTITLLFILLLQLSALFSNAPANIFITNPSIELSTTSVIIKAGCF